MIRKTWGWDHWPGFQNDGKRKTKMDEGKSTEQERLVPRRQEVTCPKCSRNWDLDTEQATAVNLFNRCIACSYKIFSEEDLDKIQKERQIYITSKTPRGHRVDNSIEVSNETAAEAVRESTDFINKEIDDKALMEEIKERVHDFESLVAEVSQHDEQTDMPDDKAATEFVAEKIEDEMERARAYREIPMSGVPDLQDIKGTENEPYNEGVPATQGGIKHDAGKLRYDLLPILPIEEVVRILTEGCKEYGDRNWEDGIDYSRCYAATQRHITAFWGGESVDPKSGHSHLGHAICELLFLSEFEKRETGEDDRPYVGDEK